MRPSELNTTMIRSCATRLLDSDTSWQPDGYAFLLVLDGALALQSADPDLCGSDTLYIIPDRQKVILKPQNQMIHHYYLQWDQCLQWECLLQLC